MTPWHGLPQVEGPGLVVRPTAGVRGRVYMRGDREGQARALQIWRTPGWPSTHRYEVEGTGAVGAALGQVPDPAIATATERQMGIRGAHTHAISSSGTQGY